jgi:hypothetical protein
MLLREKNYQALEEFLDLIIKTFDITEDAGMLPFVFHQNNQRLMYEKWPHGEEAKGRTHADKFNILEQQAKFRKYILTRYQVSATVAGQAAISNVGNCKDCQYSIQKPKETQSKNQPGQ